MTARRAAAFLAHAMDGMANGVLATLLGIIPAFLSSAVVGSAVYGFAVSLAVFGGFGLRAHVRSAQREVMAARLVELEAVGRLFDALHVPVPPVPAPADAA